MKEEVRMRAPRARRSKGSLDTSNGLLCGMMNDVRCIVLDVFVGVGEGIGQRELFAPSTLILTPIFFSLAALVATSSLPPPQVFFFWNGVAFCLLT